MRPVVTELEVVRLSKVKLTCLHAIPVELKNRCTEQVGYCAYDAGMFNQLYIEAFK